MTDETTKTEREPTIVHGAKTGRLPPKPAGDERLQKLFKSVNARCKSFKERLASDVAEQMANPDRPASELAHVYGAFREIADQISALNKIVGDATSSLGSERIPAAFEREDISTFTTKSGYRVTVSERYVASIKTDMKEEAKAWLRKNGLDAIVIETVNASTLSAAGKSMIEDQGKELPDHLFNAAFLKGTSLTKVKK